MADPISRQLNTIRQLVGKPIRAYHGSPHSFSRFDASKIGTGEGAQAYGHGLYFAGDPRVAAEYRNRLAGVTPLEEVVVAGRRLSPSNRWNYSPRNDTIEENVLSTLLENMLLDEHGMRAAGPGVRDLAIETLRSRSRHYPDEWPEAVAAAESLERKMMAPGGVQVRFGKQPGATYEVEIDYPEEAFLDWDRPVGAELAGRLDSRMAGDLAAEAQRMADMGQLPSHMQALNRIASGEIGLAPGEMVYRAAGRFDAPASDLASVPGVPSGWGNVTSTINDSLTNQAKASARLLDAGIPGIRYLDQGSRRAGEGTRNYVMFPGTEDNIRILRKYGLLAPMALPALQGEE